MNDKLINAYQNELAFMKQERNKWKERTKKAVKERNNLQSKIDKAIEYIKNNTWEDEYGGDIIEDYDHKLLDILKEDK